MTDPDLERRLRAVEFSLQKLWARMDALAPGAPPIPIPPTPPPLPPKPAPIAPARLPEPIPVAPTPLSPPLPVPASSPAQGMEWKLGATWLNRLGAIALLLAMVYFVSYSFKQGWITPAMRCLFGGGLSLVLAGGGEWLRRRGQRGFSQGITGAGIGMAYVSAYAAHALYGLIPVPVAFLLMTAATAMSILLGAWGNAQAVAVLGYLGGIVTPLLLRTGRDPIWSLAPYLLALSAGAVFQGRKRDWAVVRWLAWGGSVVLLAGWADAYLGPATRIPFTAAALALALMFQGDALTRIGRGTGTADALLLALNALLATAAVFMTWDGILPRWMGTLAVLGALLQAWSGWRGWLRDAAHPAGWVVIAHAAALLAVAVPLQWDGKGVALGWGAQVLVAAWACRRYERRWLSLHALGTAILALGHLAVFEEGQLSRASAFLSFGPWSLTTPLMAFLAVAGACLLGGILLSGRVSVAAHALAVISSLAALGGSVGAFPGFAGTLPGWAWAGGLFALAASRWEGLRRHAWIVSVVLLGKLWLGDVSLDGGWRASAGASLLSLRVLAVAASVAVFGFAGFFDRKASPQGKALGVLLAVLSLLGGVSLEIHRAFVGVKPEPGFLPFDERFVFTAVWAAGVLALAWLCASLPALRPAAWALAGLVLAKFWLSDVCLRGGWEALSVPRLVLSPRSLAALMAACVAAALAWKDRQAPRGLRAAAGVLAALTLLGWASLEIHRGFVGMQVEPSRLSDGEQIAHSAAWALGAAAALAVGFLRRQRPVRVGGLVGIGLVALKVLIIDLAGVATIYRVGILFVLGILSLGASYAYHKLGKGEAG